MDASAANSTRDKLIETAKELFLTKGVDRVGVREIATKAGINLSLMNYYFRSKEMLFEAIFEMLINEKALVLKQILDSDKPLEEKIRSYVYTYIDILIEDPLLVSFVLSAIHRNNEKIVNLKAIYNLYNTDSFVAQLKREADLGRIKPIEPEQFYVSMISLILFPFSIKPLIADRNRLDERAAKLFLVERKKTIYEMLIASIRF
ncbi:MAG: TetR/AcrR family transcriptional regulator [Bacteroidales bacterium]|nr:MAG: TetR/AcrR family transcriptional regulator [Bacteroidales bacterium]